MVLMRSLIILLLHILIVDNRMLPIYYETEAPVTDQDVLTITDVSNDRTLDEKVVAETINIVNDRNYDLVVGENEKENRPCAIVVLSNIQNPTMQSLLRKYRYDANGILIPSSVKYFIKLHQGLKSSSVLVPLNDKAFSPHGGFVRYYKEVPPIPHAL